MQEGDEDVDENDVEEGEVLPESDYEFDYEDN